MVTFGFLFCLDYEIIKKEPKKHVWGLVKTRKPRSMNPSKLFVMNLARKPLIVFKEGHIVIGTEDEHQALVISNLLKSLLANIQCYPEGIKVSRLIETYYNSEYECDFTNFSHDPCCVIRGTITEKSLKEAILEAREVYKNKRVREDLLLLNDARHHMNNRDYAASFLFSWIIIERKIFSDWDDAIRSLEFDNDTQSQFLNHKTDWMLSKVLETSYLTGLIPEDKYKRFAKLRDIRNSIAHNYHTVTPEEAKKCFGLADMIRDYELLKIKKSKKTK